MRLFTLLLLSFLISGDTAYAEASKIKETISNWQRTNQIQGISVSIHMNGQTTNHVSGWAHKARKQLLTPNDTFNVASVTKSFTAGLILMLAEKEALDLKDSASNLSLPHFGGTMSIEDLLFHQTSLREFVGGSLSFETFLTEFSNGRELWTSHELEKFIVQVNTLDTKAFHYTNTNYVILGKIVEEKSGMPLNEAYQEMIFKPMHLSSTTLAQNERSAASASGYSTMLEPAIGSPQVETRLSVNLASLGNAAGGIVSNAPDLVNWAHYYLSKLSNQPEFFQTPSGGTAFGLSESQIKVGPGAYKVKYGTREFILHGGDGMGYSALIMHSPDLEASIAILSNDDAIRSLGFGASGYLDELATEIFSVIEH